MKRRGLILVISAPSGCGKTTLVKRLLAGDKKLKRSVSLTTRKPRRDERNGDDYFFVSREEFIRRKKRGKLAEWARVFGDFYGTPRKFIEDTRGKGYDVVLVIDVEGKRQIKRVYPKSIAVFILPPSIKSLAERLRKRKSEPPRAMRARLERARKELVASGGYDYLVTNDTIARAVKRLRAIIASERGREKLKE